MNCMKHRKEKRNTKADKVVRDAVQSYVKLSMLLGHEKAMQILKESTKKEVTGE